MKKVVNKHATRGASAAAAALDTWLKAQTGRAAPTFDEIRAAVPELADARDGEIHQAALDAGYKVEP